MAPKSTWETFAFVSGIGFHFVITIGVCIFLGQKADIYFQTSPIFTLTGIILGVITAIYTAYKKIKDVNKA
ncbi:AtpZ/AtpI family protein [uncultured Megamonas sp.]|uniref:AtpZ/AtpI family protein n=1 Tax=uncultured Megamonas sp. TaxID=286140 RepID=UPI0025E4556D|nr:AtpZ/AtpI family protein [uncultured Megamonas sp.]